MNPLIFKHGIHLLVLTILSTASFLIPGINGWVRMLGLVLFIVQVIMFNRACNLAINPPKVTHTITTLEK
jgi:hypothetical protein